jgi:hypothetical protein
MTPTEQDNELREKLTNMQVEFCKKCGMDNLIPHIIDTDDNAGQAMRDDLIQLITADRKRVALEAKIEESKLIAQLFVGLPTKTMKRTDLKDYLINRITELKAQQEEA